MSLPEVKSSLTHGQGLFATRPYTENDTIIADLRPSVLRAIRHQDLGTICYHCLDPPDEHSGGLECPTCHMVHFCSRMCQARAIGVGHKLECLYFLEHHSNETFMAVVRVVMLHADGRLGAFQVRESVDLYANSTNQYSTRL